jgi:hypothetical protein
MLVSQQLALFSGRRPGHQVLRVPVNPAKRSIGAICIKPVTPPVASQVSSSRADVLLPPGRYRGVADFNTIT